MGPHNQFPQISRARRVNFHKFLDKQGFTLLEMMISTGIFAVLVVSTIGVTLDVSNSQIKASNSQTTQDNIRFTLELITKEMRTGSLYALSTKCAASGSEISFLTSLHEPRTYYLDPATKTIMRATQSVTGADCTNPDKFSPLTSEEITIDRLSFILRGADAGLGRSDGQPLVIINLKVRSKSPKLFLESSVDLQTTITQRLRDL